MQDEIAAKKVVGRVVAAAGIVILAIPIGATALYLKAKNGKALFTQERLGMNQKPFKIYKFCTMKENNGQGLVTADDKNSSSRGRFEQLLRNIHFDEILQLWNVVKGEMCIVGPRPHTRETFNDVMVINKDYINRFRVPPGMIGVQQVSDAQMYNTADPMKISMAVKMDNQYVDNFGLENDLKIIGKALLKFAASLKNIKYIFVSNKKNSANEKTTEVAGQKRTPDETGQTPRKGPDDKGNGNVIVLDDTKTAKAPVQGRKRP